MLPLLFVSVSSQRPSPIFPFNDSPPTAPKNVVAELLFPPATVAEVPLTAVSPPKFELGRLATEGGEAARGDGTTHPVRIASRSAGRLP